jgi:thymidylate synthase
MKQYQDLIKHVLYNGTDRADRTGTGTRSVFGHQARYNLQDGFPAVTTKKLAWKAVVGELLWILEGSTDERRLAELTFSKPREELVNKATIWTANADNQGKSLGYTNRELVKENGPIYGQNWRAFTTTLDIDGAVSPYGKDQISWVINEIKTNPTSRRLIVSAWNPETHELGSLSPCHTMFQFYVQDGKLSCQLYQRSCDIGLGHNFNLVSYALLTHIIAKECNLAVGDFVHTIGDAHIYNDHLEALQTILSREPLPLPTLSIADDFDLVERLGTSFRLTDVGSFTLNNYEHYDSVYMKMSV